MLGMIEVLLLLLLFAGIPFLIALGDLLSSEFTGYNKIVWLLTVILLPVLGPILYFMIGRKQKIQK